MHLYVNKRKMIVKFFILKITKKGLIQLLMNHCDLSPRTQIADRRLLN